MVQYKVQGNRELEAKAQAQLSTDMRLPPAGAGSAATQTICYRQLVLLLYEISSPLKTDVTTY